MKFTNIIDPIPTFIF